MSPRNRFRDPPSCKDVGRDNASRSHWIAIAAIVAIASALLVLSGTVRQIEPTASAAVASQLKRYPYLSDVVGSTATINWGTDRSAISGSVKYGTVGGSCTTNTVAATRTGITVNGVSEYQWKATISVSPNTQYCYRVYLKTTDLLGSDPSPAFWSQIPRGSSTPYTFAVLGDIGRTTSSGVNVEQAALLSRLAASGARFALGTGDTAYDLGSQKNYGDLVQTGRATSTIFGPEYWTKPGRSMPFFNALGNHGYNNTFLNVWPQTQAVSGSGGTYQMETYCCKNGTASKSYPSAWYAFDAGVARFYILDAAWADSNFGTGTPYQNDYAYHWTTTSPEYRWLEDDLASHPSKLKFAVWHYPLYSDDAGQPSDTWLRGPTGLQGLLNRYGVDIAFNGHAHVYERNQPDSGGMISYITGGGGAELATIDRCSSFDAYSIGWNTTTSVGSACNAPTPTSASQVFHFLLVRVNGSQVTVTPTDSTGRTFDVQTFDFGSSDDTQAPTVPTNLTASAPRPDRVDLDWNASSDNVGVTKYEIFRDGVFLDSTSSGSTTAFADTAVISGHSYTYKVRAVDAAGNRSGFTAGVSVTTPTDVEPPTAPGSLDAIAQNAHRIDLSWTASTDDVAVTAYNIYRGTQQIDSVGGTSTTFSDTTVAADTTYTYTVVAVDAAGNTSNHSNEATATTPANAALFTDDFESGSLSAWTVVNGITAEQGFSAPSGGAWVARQQSAGVGGTYAYKAISPTETELYAQFRFKVLSRSGSVDLMRFRSSTGNSKLSLYISSTTGTLATRNPGGQSTRSDALISNGVWYRVEVHAAVGATGQTEVWLNGVHLPELDASGDLGTLKLGQFLIGHTTAGTYDVLFDDVVVDRNFI